MAERAGHGERFPFAAVLFDRDGTLVDDVPYNGDPRRVRPVPGAGALVRLLRREGIAVGVVTNQSGIARGRLTRRQVLAVNRRIDAVVGPFDGWSVCPHAPGDGCPCRKPSPGMVLGLAARFGVPVARCLVIGDIGADVEAASAAGAVGVLVPTPRTRAVEVEAAPLVASDLCGAVALACDRWPA